MSFSGHNPIISGRRSVFYTCMSTPKTGFKRKKMLELRTKIFHRHGPLRGKQESCKIQISLYLPIDGLGTHHPDHRMIFR